MRNSEIFDNFVKIAEEQTPTKSKKTLEENPRADSLSVADIEKLYGIKPDSPKDMHYERNIIELAHPVPFVISPSYDKLHGLVENENERQDITVNILNKVPNGHLTQHKYAEKNFLMSLVRLGNHLDNQNKDELRTLSDTCLAQISNKSMEKLAAVPVIGLALAASSLLGTLYAQQHLPMAIKGFQENHNMLVKEVNDLNNSSVNLIGYGYEVTPALKEILNKLKQKLNHFKDVYEQDYKIIQELQRPKTGKELLEIVKDPENDVVMTAYHTLKSTAEDMVPFLQQIQTNFSDEMYKSENIKQKGKLNEAVDWTRALHGGAGLISDDFDDVVHAIPPYLSVISKTLEIFKNAESYKAKAKRDMEESVAKSNSTFSPETTGKKVDPTLQEADHGVFSLDGVKKLVGL